MKYAADSVFCFLCVTPHAGVRIEILMPEHTPVMKGSPPTRGCELKLHYNVWISICQSHPPRGGAN